MYSKRTHPCQPRRYSILIDIGSLIGKSTHHVRSYSFIFAMNHPCEKATTEYPIFLLCRGQAHKTFINRRIAYSAVRSRRKILQIRKIDTEQLKPILQKINLSKILWSSNASRADRPMKTIFVQAAATVHNATGYQNHRRTNQQITTTRQRTST